MDLMLEKPFSFFINKKLDEIPIFGTFLVKKMSFSLYFGLYYVIVTSYANWFSWFWYQWKEATLPYSMISNNFTLGVSI